MNWSIKLGRFADIDVNIHLTFLLLLGFIGINAYWNFEGRLASGCLFM